MLPRVITTISIASDSSNKYYNQRQEASSDISTVV
jgi:hypothetical protein